MAKILYGVCGEGMGHSIRSKVVIDWALKKGYEVEIVAGKKAYEFFKNKSYRVSQIHSFFMDIQNNKLKDLTLVKNIWPFMKDYFPTKELIKQRINNFKPNFIVSDFEPFTSYIGKNFDIPTFSIENISSIVRTTGYFPKGHDGFYSKIAKLTTKVFSPDVDFHFIPSFFPIRVKKEFEKNTAIVPPILRPEIFNLEPIEGDHSLVYQTSTTNVDLIHMLEDFRHEKFIVYGLNQKGKNKNIEYKKFNEEQFLEDLCTSKAVITNGGFTLMGEAIYLGKPVLSEPIQKYSEQIFNSFWLLNSGYGMFVEKIDKKDLVSFLGNLGDYRNNLKGYHQDRNKKFFNLLESKIEEFC